MLFVEETRGHVELEGRGRHRQPRRGGTSRCEPPGGDRSLSAASQAGLVNNLNDGVAWGLLPVYFAAAGLSLPEIGILVAAYPAVWGIGQVATGALSDRVGRKRLIVAGMLLQAASIAAIALATGFGPWLVAAVGLGLGTAMVYPTLLAVVADVAAPAWRASAIGVYRLWRDLGFAIGAIVAGILADAAGIRSDPCGGRVDGCLWSRRPGPDARDAAASRGRSGREHLPVVRRQHLNGVPATRATAYRSGVPRDPNIPEAFDVYALVLLRRPDDAPELPEHERRRSHGTLPTERSCAAPASWSPTGRSGAVGSVASRPPSCRAISTRPGA